MYELCVLLKLTPAALSFFRSGDGDATQQDRERTDHIRLFGSDPKLTETGVGATNVGPRSALRLLLAC